MGRSRRRRASSRKCAPFLRALKASLDHVTHECDAASVCRSRLVAAAARWVGVRQPETLRARKNSVRIVASLCLRVRARASPAGAALCRGVVDRCERVTGVPRAGSHGAHSPPCMCGGARDAACMQGDAVTGIGARNQKYGILRGLLQVRVCAYVCVRACARSRGADLIIPFATPARARACVRQIRCWEAARSVFAQLNEAGLDPAMLPAVHSELRSLLGYLLDPMYATLASDAGGTGSARAAAAAAHGAAAAAGGGGGGDAEMVPDDGILRPVHELAAVPAAIAPLIRALGPHLSNDVYLFAKVRF